jgi:hypothetical protein
VNLSKQERAVNAENPFRTFAVPERDKTLIANVLRAHPVDNIEQWAALGRACPYWQNQKRERQTWVDEIHRQREELGAGR